MGLLEEAVEASGLEWTHIEPVDFMGNSLHWARDIRTAGRVEEPFGDSLNAVVHEDDVAAVAATTLVEDGHAGKRYPVTGPEALSPSDKLKIIGEQLGRDLEFVELTEAQARQRWQRAGVGDELIDLLVKWAADPPEAAYTVVPTVEELTGRQPRTFRQWVAENAGRFR